ncbi:hypothetical protein NDU88_002257 [Pleurodeles waltl]|uniref:Uncharacterized protein n=1 Tax=Pleurodeles waltl TaxID=8319 RepID=A0AAV7UWQ9_PLEWA|nr:hypothetical protein NDU88_002257 [Pleurodeles waltl]
MCLGGDQGPGGSEEVKWGCLPLATHIIDIALDYLNSCYLGPGDSDLIMPKRRGAVSQPMDCQSEEPMVPAASDMARASTSTAHTDAKLNKILEAIADTKQELCGRVDAMAVEMGLVRKDLRKLTS